MTNIRYIVVTVGFAVLCSGTELAAQTKDQYFGFPAPGLKPEVFAPGVISKNDRGEMGSAFTADGKVMYFGVRSRKSMDIRRIKWDGKSWSDPEIIVDDAHDPALSLDDKKLYFVYEKRPRGADLGYVDLSSNNVPTKPVLLGAPVNTDAIEYYISFTATEDLLFSSNRKTKQQGGFDIFIAKMQNGQYVSVERLPNEINSPHYEVDAHIAPDGSYLIFVSTRPDALGGSGLYISFAKANGGWTPAIPMGDEINKKGEELCPFVTRDGRYLFFSRNGNIHWVDTKILDPLRKQAMQK